MVAKFRAQAAAATPRHFNIPSSTERIWRYIKGRENFRQTLGFASFVKLEFSSACVVGTPSKPRQKCRFSERDVAVTPGRIVVRAEEKGPSMQGSRLWTASQGLKMEVQRGFVGRLAERQKTAGGVKVNGGELLGAELQYPSDEDERELWSMRLGVCEGTRVQSPKRKGDRTRVDDIPLSELVKIQELKFSGDMWEGDRGPEVLDLQRALYWFGFLPTETSLTAYFGPETKEALQQFQTQHGISSTGVWGPASRQALWKHLCTESHVFSEGGTQVQSKMQPVASFTDSLSGLKAAGEKQVGICVSELLHLMSAQGLFSTVSSAPQWKHIPRNASMVAVLFAVVVGLLGLGYSVIGMFQGQHGQPVRRRVMRAHWRDDVRGGDPLKTKKQLHMFPGLGRPVRREQKPKYPSHQLHSKSRPGQVDAAGQTDHLIMYDGQVILGNSPLCCSALRNSPTGLCGSSTSRLQASSKARRPSVPVANAAEQVPTKQMSAKSAGNHGGELCNVKCKMEGGKGLSQQTGKSIILDNESHDTMLSVLHNVPSASSTTCGIREPLLFEKPFNGQAASKSALQSEAEIPRESSNREGQTQDRLGSLVAGSERKYRVQNGGGRQNKDDVNLRDRVEELRKAVRAAEQNRHAAMNALAEERQRSLELQVKISRQKEAAVAMEEEVRVLKESHDALVAALQKKYSSSVAARATAALLYQDWDTSLDKSIQNVASV